LTFLEQGRIVRYVSEKLSLTKNERKDTMTNNVKGVVDTVVAIRTTTTTIKNDTKVIALDETNAKELLAKFEANKADKATLEAQ
jgi:hypothetical protein